MKALGPTADTVRAESVPFRLNIILAPTDFSQPANAAFDYATRLARPVGGRVILLNVIRNPIPAVFDASEQTKITGEIQKRLDDASNYETGEREPRAVLGRGGATGLVASWSQISLEYGPSVRLAICPAALAVPFPSYFPNTLSDTDYP